MNSPKLNHYKVILADPPWNFKTFSKKGRDRCADKHYDVMSMEEIKELPVKDWSADDCILFLWIVDWIPPLYIHELLEAWNFKYKTVGFTWTKEKPSGKEHIGCGYYTRSGPEQCIIATKGHPKVVNHSVRQWIHSPVREHSRKPDEIYQRIEQLMGDVPRLEMFSRTSAPNWDVWGLETDKFEIDACTDGQLLLQ